MGRAPRPSPPRGSRGGREQPAGQALVAMVGRHAERQQLAVGRRDGRADHGPAAAWRRRDDGGRDVRPAVERGRDERVPMTGMAGAMTRGASASRSQAARSMVSMTSGVPGLPSRSTVARRGSQRVPPAPVARLPQQSWHDEPRRTSAAVSSERVSAASCVRVDPAPAFGASSNVAGSGACP